MIDIDDTKIIIGCYQGKPGAQEAFVSRFSNLIYSTIKQTLAVKQVTYQRQDLEDLHNTIFLKLLERRCRKLRQYKGKNGCSLPSWIRMISVRIVIDHLRSRTSSIGIANREYLAEDFELIADQRVDIWGMLNLAEKLRLVEEGMRLLLPRDRLFLQLHFFNDLPIREVAYLLKVNENNAYSIKHRALRRLKSVLKPLLNKN